MNENIQHLVKIYLEDFLRLGEIEDAEINTYIVKNKERVDALIATNTQLEKPQCVLDYVASASRGNHSAISFLSFLNRQALEVFEKADTRFHNRLSRILKSILFSLELDITEFNPSFLNYVGEICALNHILSFPNNQFELKQIEQKMPNGKQADFVFYDKKNNNLLYMDCLSIHNIDVNKIEIYTDLVLFLENKFNDKIIDKTKNLETEDNLIILDNNNQVSFAILPIIWKETVELLPYKQAFEELDKKYLNVFPCCSLLPQKVSERLVEYKFTTVKNILERWDNQIIA